MMLSTAPRFEDVFLHRCLGRCGPMPYAELDAADPESDSVSQWFDLSGWQGVILPAGDAAAWRAARPNAELAKEGVEYGWEEIAPFGFIHFARARGDAEAIIAAARPLIALGPGLGGIEGYSRIHEMTGVEWLARADRAAEFAACLSLPLARDEFDLPERQAGALARMLSLAEAEAARLRMGHEDAHRRIAARDHEIDGLNQELQARDREIQARDRQIAALSLETESRDRKIAVRDGIIGERDQEIARLNREIERLRPGAERLTRLAQALEWPEGPFALRSLLPLARAIRRLRGR
jgi:hypothetical protein